MSANREARVKHLRRPKKKAPEKIRRQKAQKKRLVALGMEAADVAKMPVKKVRALVRKPAVAKKIVARKKAKTVVA